MGASGHITVDFGAFPGQSDVTYLVTGADITIAGLLATSEVEAWVEPNTTADHTADEHAVESIAAFADKSTIVAGTSFVVRVRNTSEINEPIETVPGENSVFTASATTIGVKTASPGLRDHLLGTAGGGRGTRIYGKWNIGIAWN